MSKLHGIPETAWLGKPITLINTPTHQRWWLPNRDYWHEVKIVNTPAGAVARHRFVHNETQRVVAFEYAERVIESIDLPLRNPRYAEITQYIQKLAEKKFRRPSPTTIEGTKKRTRLFYNVVNIKEPKKALMEDVAFLHMAQQFKAVQTIRYPSDTFEIVEIERGQD